MEHKGWHSRGFVPHFDSMDVAQFVTYRLADSLPRHAIEAILAAPRPQTLQEKLLDRGLGACWLKSDEIAQFVEEAFLFFDGDRYSLHGWTVMPNHVHVLLSPLPGWQLGAIVSSWKRFTGREANKRLNRTGPFWKVDYWDRYIRDETHYLAALNYIDFNPVKAGLISEPEQWRWGSARLRLQT